MLRAVTHISKDTAQPVREPMTRREDGEATPIIAGEYLRSLPVAARRRSGQVYTPQHLVRQIYEQALEDLGQRFPDLSVLDPACGDGAFLEAAVLLLAAHLERMGPSSSSPAGRLQLLEVVSSRVFGVDIDPQACSSARAVVRSAIGRATGVAAPEGFFESNIVKADFLLEPLDDVLSAHSSSFGLIIGNPPYVSTTRMDAAYKAGLRARFTTARGRFDLYTLFMERAIALLRDGGRFAFITPDKFLASESARPLRELVAASGAIRSVTTFTSHRIFKDAATVPCITVFERGSEATNLDVMECADGPDRTGRMPVRRRYAMPQSGLAGGSWLLRGPDLNELAGRIQGSHRSLEVFTARISAGIASGYDKAFLLPRASTQVEDELRRPAIRGRDLHAFRLEDPFVDLIVPYVFDATSRPRLADLREFPGARAHLQLNRLRLEARHCVRVWEKAWYDLHDPISSDLASVEKILVPDVAKSNRFAVDEGRFLPLHSAYYLVPKGVDPYYLAAILNSSPIQFLIRLRAPIVKDGFRRYRRQFLAGLPIPVSDCKTTNRLAEIAERGAGPEEIDSIALGLFGLSRRDARNLNMDLDDAPVPGGTGRTDADFLNRGSTVASRAGRIQAAS
jgi:adenine-specific DNA-methyltransferase